MLFRDFDGEIELATTEDTEDTEEVKDCLVSSVSSVVESYSRRLEVLSARWALFEADGPPQTGPVCGPLDEPFGSRIIRKRTDDRHGEIAALRDADGEHLDAPSTVEDSRARRLIGHFEEDRLVRGVRVDAAVAKHLDRDRERCRGHHGRLLELARQRRVRRPA